jgi:SAM-dependent methyltransferase
LPLSGEVEIKIVEGDFNRNMEFPMVDNILMANALHYAEDPISVLKNVLNHLKPGGQFILIEYETERAISQWVPYPIPFSCFQKIALACGLSEPIEIGKVPSTYGHEHIYAALSKKPNQ